MFSARKCGSRQDSLVTFSILPTIAWHRHGVLKSQALHSHISRIGNMYICIGNYCLAPERAVSDNVPLSLFLPFQQRYIQSRIGNNYIRIGNYCLAPERAVSDKVPLSLVLRYQQRYNCSRIGNYCLAPDSAVSDMVPLSLVLH